MVGRDFFVFSDLSFQIYTLQLVVIVQYRVTVIRIKLAW